MLYWLAAGWRGPRCTPAHLPVAECAGVALVLGILREWMSMDDVVFIVKPLFCGR